MYHPFSVVRTIKTAWYIFEKNFVTIIVYSVISFILFIAYWVLCRDIYYRPKHLQVQCWYRLS